MAPWWHLSSGSRPTYIQTGVATSAVDELTVIATSGPFVLEWAFVGGQKTAPIPFNANAAAVQSALEAVPQIGPGNVEVTGPAAGPFTIAFIGALADQTVALFVDPYGGGGIEAKVTAKVTEITPGRSDGEIVLQAENVGDANIDGETTPVKITDTLPPHLRALAIAANTPGAHAAANAPASFPCSLSTLTCTLSRKLVPYDSAEVRIAVEVEPGAQSGEQNQLSVSGGGAPAASAAAPITISPAPTPFGVAEYRLSAEAEGGAPVSAAGAHPFQVTGTVAINQLANPTPVSAGHGDIEPAVLAKDIKTELPPGLIGNPTQIPTCSLSQFLTVVNEQSANACPTASVLGASTVIANEPIGLGTFTFVQPVVNLEPAYGEPARFGFFVAPGLANVPVVLDTALRSGPGESLAAGPAPDYGIDVNATNISQTASLSQANVTFWGTPGDPAHDNSRGFGCLLETRESIGGQHAPCLPSAAPSPPPFLAVPTSCAGPLPSAVKADAWLQPGLFLRTSSEPLPTLDGCNQVPFSPTIHSEPTSNAATSPTGFNFDLNVEDEGLFNSKGRVQSQIKKAVVTLPQGFTTNPSVAEGLKACTEAEYEASTVQPGSGCNEGSKIGTVELESPLVNPVEKIRGSLFVATQHDNPNHNLLTLYMVIQSPELGVLIKSAGKVEPNPVTGQLTTTFDDIPQVPFSHFRLSFRQGQRSPLVTPPTCGNYTVKALLYPWSEPTVPREEQSSFAITQGPEGGPCPNGVPPFHPNLEAGTQNNAAGTYSPFYVHMTRKDSEQEITHFSIKLPPGVSGKLAGIPYCPDAGIAAAKAREHEGGGTEELNSPSCPAASEVGHSLVGSGVGNVLAYAPGKMYLAGPYHGSNLSLVSITAAKVGPFDLGTVVVRFALRINPETAEVSVDGQTSDPIPHIVDGIPVHLRDIRAYVDRPNFVLNPTNCERTSTASTVLGSGLNFASEADDVPVTVTSPFQAADCASLGFKPNLALSLKGGTHRGATPAFKAVLTYPKGSYANIAESQVTLPHSEFLEQAHIGTVCTRVQFKEGNVPGEKCPAASVYGKAEAITPLLAEPLKGPVYLRSSSHNLPDLVAALHSKQADIALDGRIDSVQNGRIRNTFENVPDAPVSKFVLEMQGGKKGLLVNSTNICAKKNRAISDFTGQNGKVSDTNPVLSVPCGGKGKKKGKGAKKH